MAPITTRRGNRTAAAVFPCEEDWEAEEDEGLLRDTSAAAGTEPDGAE